ncbi:MAG: Mitochondrial translocator assembly and maintenance protein 41 [Icmadophila ericetorum]|nr:Mitochondrial translocator assembly and maintenance protein 41 [Icmadophila ericetorum]
MGRPLISQTFRIARLLVPRPTLPLLESARQHQTLVAHLRRDLSRRPFSLTWVRSEAERKDVPSPAKSASEPLKSKKKQSKPAKQPSSTSAPSRPPGSKSADQAGKPPPDWDEHPDLSISAFSQLPFSDFGVNQHMIINEEFKEALRQILWQFRAPIRYAFAYGSGVFPQTATSPATSPSKLHTKPDPAISTVQGGKGKMIDFIFGVSYTQHWHSLNLQQHRDHYSAVGSLGSYVVSRIQDNWGAGVYFNPYVTVNGTLVKYGVVNLDTLCQDLSEWDTLYLAGRLQKPVKILRDDPRVRLANQVNLISAVRTALLLLPETFTERDLYSTIAGISYLGDPRMSLPAENLNKVSNIVRNQLPNFRRLYRPLIENLPNVSFQDPRCSQPDWDEDPTTNASLAQDMDPTKRGNMVRRLPKAFRKKLYFQYQSKYEIPGGQFNKMLEESSDEDPTRVKRRQAGPFEKRIGSESQLELKQVVSTVIKKTIAWPSMSQTLKGPVTGGFIRTSKYLMEKYEKYRQGQKEARDKKAEKENKERDEKEKGA